MKRGIDILRITSVILVIGIAAVALWAFFVEPNWLAVRKIELEVPGLPPELDGMRIAHVSDLHSFPEPDHPGLLKKIASEVKQWQPDLIFFGGDFVHGTASVNLGPSLPDLTVWLKQFSAPLGCFAVLGNHELWFHRQRIRRSVEAAGCPVLAGDARLLSFRGKEFLLLGIDDYNTSPLGENTVPENLPPDLPLIVLAHNPISSKFLPPRRGAVMFAGHTHGGQIRLPGWGPLRKNPFKEYPVDEAGFRPGRDPEQEYEFCWDRGAYALQGNRIFVSSGAGGDRITARLACRPEIIFATLRRPGRASSPEPLQQLYETRKKDHETR